MNDRPPLTREVLEAHAHLGVTEADRILRRCKAQVSDKARELGVQFVDRRSARMKALNADPKVQAKRLATVRSAQYRKAASDRLKEMRADRSIDMRQKHLRGLTDAQREEYDFLMKRLKYTKAEALQAVGVDA